ncbi:MAG: tRNA (adenosine(37)-N6)-dimethylallyltransferase MiaA [Muribaculaceae bacterium]|nr:tRNA (adenosine(37)-N6)-dimethylallyltransferase MiaA [Muribaculaceae bacterium]
MSGKGTLAVVVTGPTASGKTSLAIALAQHFGTEIISADSRQLYRDIPIGTAAPSAEERACAFHHLVGVLGLDEYYSAARFEADALAILPQIWRKSPVAVICGGSMMYIDALVRGIDDMPDVSPEVRAYVKEMHAAHGLEGVLAQLAILDPDYYAEVDRANTRRVMHAVEISLQAGKPYSLFRTGQTRKRPFDIVQFAIDRPRDELFARINARVDAMIAAGLEDEARTALAKGDFNSLNTVGYKEIAAMMRGDMDRDTAIARIAKNTRVYAKKQLTWMARRPDIIRLRPDDAVARAIAIVEEKLSGSANFC